MDPAEPRRIRWAVGLTRAGMCWEALAAAFWPLGVVLALVLAALAFGATDLFSSRALIWLMGLVGLAAVLAFGWGVRRFRRPSAAAARLRVDLTLPGRPLSALRDRLVLGAGDGGADALWRAHLARMEQVASAARPVAPDARLRWRDPVALRLAGMVALVMALVFAPAGQLGQGLAALGATFRPLPEARPGAEAGPSWEGWAAPPAYTRRPTLYLNALPEGQGLELPKGSKLSFRLYGEGAEIAQDIGVAVPGGDPAAPEFMAERDGAIEVAGRRFDVTVLPDAVPVVAPGKAPERRADGRLVQEFTASDDNGIAAGHAVIALDLDAVDRRFGLALDPEPREAVELELPLPATGSRKQIRGRLVGDLARHPWANLPVTVSLKVEDGIEQQGVSAPMRMVLPGRRFFDPLAAALIEVRRDLLWSRDNAARSAQILRAASWQPEGFMEEELYHGLRGAVGTLESGNLGEEARNKLAQLLWDAAVALEDGGLADALERMQQAQERLSEAIRNGASPDEIQRLMDELKQATDDYLDMLAQQQGQDPAERFDRSPQNRQQITGDQIQQMMDEIQRLMNEGRMAEAQELLEQFNRMMQNMRVTQSEGGEGGRQRPMNRLAETLRDQQKLADEAMRQMQDRFGQWQPGEEGQEGQGDQQGQQLADRQRELREDLGRQRGLLPGHGTPQGEEARRQLDEAGRAMEDAEQALREGDAAGAMERQAQAIQSMREGMRALGDMMAQDQQQGQDGQPQQGGQQDGPEGPSGDPRGQRGLAQPYDRQPQTDPLGRALSGDGGSITSGDPLAEGGDPSRKARELQDEIRRRSGERERPRDERDYLGRLLENF
ncbi:DUF4175 domain-containing protein [Paracoccus versutus]|uniref:Uncharacterized protein (TIGR02302 family) n=1 Tax=Paracoccus versutus TaxID=34007 RepID=A0AAQ0HHV9_PARVE|nr:DUF4175 domain-containing protein [Paracoccus versutus]KGJ07970.1 hypothetical protein IT40_19635 [Paracoccus versutus]REG47693.1 uncharacterized protein (TIGR02302 family) [Paracoccus versutus]WEJ79786.1 DUF4175 domain-containing protein [Paracoccus versutus]